MQKAEDVLDAIGEPAQKADAVRVPTARQALGWWIGGLRLWRRAPLRLTIVCLIPLAIEAMLQLIPVAGVLLSKLVVPMVAMGAYVVLDQAWRNAQVPWRELFWSFRPANSWIGLKTAFILMSVFAFQMVVAFALYGFPAIDAVLLGHMSRHRELMTRDFVLALILPGIIPGTLLMFATPLVVLGGFRPLRAARESIRVIGSAPAALAITCVISALLTACALVFLYGALLLVLLPWMSMMLYAAYQDVFPLAEARAARPTITAN